MGEGEPTVAEEASGKRARAAVAGHTGDEATARELLDAEVPAVRATALGALQRMDRLSADDVRRALTDPAPEVRRRAIALGVAHAEVALVPLLADSDPSVAEQAAWACGERDPAEPGAVAALAAAATGHADALVREAAVAALGAIGDDAGLDAILRATADKPAVRRRAVLALAPFDGPAVEAALRAALGDRDWQVRQAAEDLLGD